MRFLEDAKWRYATKKFDANKKVSDSDLEKIKEAIQLSASSYGLQLYKVLIVENKELREKLKPASWSQPQITDASHLLVFCNYTELKEAHISEYVQWKADALGVDIEKFKGYSVFVWNKLSEQSEEARANWTAKQTYIALDNLMMACAELKIDSCPMEGFEREQYDEILGLKEKGLSTAVVATIGYRSFEDETKDWPKVRRPKEDLFEVI